MLPNQVALRKSICCQWVYAGNAKAIIHPAGNSLFLKPGSRCWHRKLTHKTVALFLRYLRETLVDVSPNSTNAFVAVVLVTNYFVGSRAFDQKCFNSFFFLKLIAKNSSKHLPFVWDLSTQ